MHTFRVRRHNRPMPNIASVLKDEIARVARREIKAETQALKSASTKYRSDSASPEESSETRHRFSAKGLASQRKRLGLSAESLGKLIGVSGLSIYNWEGGKARPRANHLPAIAALKTLGKKDAAAVLATR